MDKIQLTEYIRSLNPEVEIKDGKQFIEITVAPDKFHDLAKQLKENSDAGFDFLFCVTGVDYKTAFEVVYHLRSSKFGHSIVLKTRITDRENPMVDSVTDIWKTADFHEREVYDLLGVKFAGHPDLRRLFLWEEKGFPLRKDYGMENNAPENIVTA